MKSLILSLFLVFSTLGWSQTEQVTRFHSEIKIDTSALITVSEDIDIISAGNIFKRGIVRYLPMHKTDSLGNKLAMNYEILSVFKDNNIVSYHTEKNNDNLVIYVGDKNSFIPNGEHSYTIVYRAENTLGFFSDFDELYWNVNGFGWDFAINEVSANVYLPNNAEPIQVKCYTGRAGSTASNCTSTQKDDHVHISSTQIGKNQNLTIAVGFEKGIVNEPPPPPPPSFLETYGLFILALLFFLGLGAYYLITWQKHGIDPPKPTVYPLFEAPENLSPASVGILHKENYWSDLITSSIVSLATKGYLKIEENTNKALFGLVTSRTFNLLKLKEPNDSLPLEELEIMNNLFATSSYKTLNGTYDSELKKVVDKYQSSINKKHKKLINEGNNYKFVILPAILIIIFMAIGIFLGFKTNSLDIQQFIYGAISIFPFIFIGFIFTSRLWSLKWIFIIVCVVAVGLFIVYMMKNPLTKDNLNLYSLFGFLTFGAISLGAYIKLIKRPSEEKLRIQSLIEGFKMYLTTAETKQLQHFNPPEVTPEVFEKFLPYAIALEADDVWGYKFQEFLDKSALDKTAYQAGWYSGSSFNALKFGHSLNSNLSNSLSASSTPPSSSSSGSGGGGFSGGGGGGGGGGGW
ncbi:DUF2207 domain-containing protein [Weeksellaceae bacterium KMM 9724]|uniref:DUF2207 domain-containing protein n=1 Tax=Profundicola chukchiensis TaxID=2961959 RepID=UPI00243E3177|nr:DUF2207 domain-containing protein [Profundicola chukchiensis]MDG4950082.1 DUF2207 domain-containing protein [Profundicola chukchiensis]